MVTRGNPVSVEQECEPVTASGIGFCIRMDEGKGERKKEMKKMRFTIILGIWQHPRGHFILRRDSFVLSSDVNA